MYSCVVCVLIVATVAFLPYGSAYPVRKGRSQTTSRFIQKHHWTINAVFLICMLFMHMQHQQGHVQALATLQDAVHLMKTVKLQTVVT